MTQLSEAGFVWIAVPIRKIRNVSSTELRRYRSGRATPCDEEFSLIESHQRFSNDRGPVRRVTGPHEEDCVGGGD